MQRIPVATDQSLALAPSGLPPALEPPWARHWHGWFVLLQDPCGAAACAGMQVHVPQRARAGGYGVPLNVAGQGTILPAVHANTDQIRLQQWANARERQRRQWPLLPAAN